MKEKFARFVQDHPIWTFVIGCCVIMIIPALFTLRVSFLPGYLITGQIGDTIGGTTAPFIGLFSAILVYLSFQEQIKANRLLSGQRREDIVIQHINSQIARIEEAIKSYAYNGYSDKLQGNVQLKGGEAILKFAELIVFEALHLEIAAQNLDNDKDNENVQRIFLGEKDRFSWQLHSNCYQDLQHILNLISHLLNYLESRQKQLSVDVITFNHDILRFIYYKELKPALKLIVSKAKVIEPHFPGSLNEIKNRRNELEITLFPNRYGG